ncbi:uncharacterized protein Dwil_GK27342 [Drosophila willistoni]|uniref:Caspase family p20 domain-containing protein n=1 Tax=Drosophila willistoni TaxID=7260 RepID=A0A0Q9X2N9_DROWI|nr:uncharacterized protein Dwil_GK27342 [Drosophila willistoni]
MVRSTVKELGSANLEEYSALVIIVLSPGKRFDKIYAKDSYYWLKSGVINPILRNATLENKPNDKDVKALEKAFDKFKCKVKVITDATRDEVTRTANDLEQANFEERSALVIVVLSHGDRNDTVMARDRTYSLNDDVLFPILKNRTLHSKPKILIVQACKGPKELFVKRNSSDFSEVLKCYSSVEGFASERDEKNGSIYIQTFCKIFEEKGKENDIELIMQKVYKPVLTGANIDQNDIDNEINSGNGNTTMS